MVLAALHDIAVNFIDLIICRLKPWKSGKMPKPFMYHFVPLKGYKTASQVLIKWKLISSSRSFVQWI